MQTNFNRYRPANYYRPHRMDTYRAEVEALGFTREQFHAMTKLALTWPDVYSYTDACMAVANTCRHYATPDGLRASGAVLGNVI